MACFGFEFDTYGIVLFLFCCWTGFGHYGGGGGDRATPSSMTKTAKREKMTEEEASRMQQILKDDVS